MEVEAVKIAISIDHLLTRMIPKSKKISPGTIISTAFLSAEALEMRFKYTFSRFLQVSAPPLKSLTLFFSR